MVFHITLYLCSECSFVFFLNRFNSERKSLDFEGRTWNRGKCGDIHLAGFLITLSPNRSFVSSSFFRPITIYKVAFIKTKSASIAFFLLLRSFSSLFLFLLSFSFVTLILELLGRKKRAFWRFSTQMTASLGWFSKNRLDIDTYIHTHIHT